MKPRSIRSGSRKIVAKAGGGNNLVSGVSHGTKKPSKVDSPSSVESLSVKKKGFGRPKRLDEALQLKSLQYQWRERKKLRASNNIH